MNKKQKVFWKSYFFYNINSCNKNILYKHQNWHVFTYIKDYFFFLQHNNFVSIIILYKVYDHNSEDTKLHSSVSHILCPIEAFKLWESSSGTV